MVERYESGATVYDLAREFGVHRTTISERLKASGVSLRFQPPGEQVVVEMVKLYESGLSLAAVGARLG